MTLADYHTIALVDDDRNIQTSVTIVLESEGYRVRTYSDGLAALEGLTAMPADLVVLDIKMPRLDGKETLKRLRLTSMVPVIFLTSKDAEVDEIEGLKLGADDYIRKPFSQALLLQRIAAVLRRADVGDSERSDGSAKSIIRGDLVLDPNRHICTWQQQTVTLTVTEFLILECLAQRPGHVKSRDQLMDAAYHMDTFVDDRTIDSHIKRLRKKFRDTDDEFSEIETLYGIGYRFRHGAESVAE